MHVLSTLVSCGFLRSLLAIWLGAAFAIFAFAGAMGLGASRWIATLVSVAIAAVVGWLSWNRPVLPLDEKATSRALSIVFVLAAILSLVQLTRLSVFIVNPAAVDYARGPNRGIGTPVRHLCMTAYFVAAQKVATVPNVYDEELYSVPTGKPDASRTPRPIDHFDTDQYEYPPPFLLLPRAVAVVTPQFLNFRMLWFALNGWLLLIGMLVVAQMFDPVIGTRVLLLSPLLLAAEITLGTLQVGQMQLTVFMLAMLAMVLIMRRRYAAGGALLAFATVSKIFPAMLIVYLTVRREWRALAWTVGLCAAFVGISIFDTGWTPYNAFLHQLPRLLSGEAFGAFRSPGPVSRNLSVPGLLFKLTLFGLPNGSLALVKLVGQIYTVIVLAVTVVLARRTQGRDAQPLIWLSILILASLRSPFLPQYGIFPVLWLLVMLAATVSPAVGTLGLTLIAWVILNIPVSRGWDPRLNTFIVLVSQGVIAVLLVLALRQRQRATVVLQPEVSAAS